MMGYAKWLFLWAGQWINRLGESYVHPSLKEEPDDLRQARLQIGFGFMGALFGSIYAAFYLLVDHPLGAAIILICGAVFLAIPWMLKKWGCLSLTGNLFAFTLLAGFTSLCLCEGGMNGHAIGWIASIPLCVLLLVDHRPAVLWSGLCLLVALGFGVCAMLGITIPEAFPNKWANLIHGAGYVGLVPFMALLGLIFERTRKQAFDKLQETLGELSQANTSLVALNEEKNEFMNIAAHDLKNPLGVIVGYGSMLQFMEDPQPQQVRDNAGQIIHSANRMLDLIRNLLDVRAIEEGRVKFNCVACPVKEVIEDIHRASEQGAISKKIDLVYDLQPLHVSADRSGIYQVLENLISNAIKYSPLESTVHISTETQSDGRVSVAVKDQGPGLSEDDQGKLFQKFSKLTPRPTAGEGSNGLGLWIVRRLAEAMEGEVWCRSKLGEGSTFGVTLLQAKEGDAAPPEDMDIFGMAA